MIFLLDVRCMVHGRPSLVFFNLMCKLDLVVPRPKLVGRISTNCVGLGTTPIWVLFQRRSDIT